MNMVGHQHVSMNAATCLAGILGQPVEIKTVILVGEKAGLAVVATLNQVQRGVWQRKAWAARHGLSVDICRLKTSKNRGLSPIMLDQNRIALTVNGPFSG